MFRIATVQRSSRISSFIHKSYKTLSAECCSQGMRGNEGVSLKTLNFLTKSSQLVSTFHTSPLVKKYNKKSSYDEEESDNDDDSDFKDERDSKVLKTKVNSLRTDLMLRAGLGMARNKIEKKFYESKIRVNGKKLSKKSAQLDVGDEIDLIKGLSHINPTHLVISRVVILSANECEEGYKVNLRRYKSLLVENYAGVDAFKSSEVSPQ